MSLSPAKKQGDMFPRANVSSDRSHSGLIKWNRMFHETRLSHYRFLRDVPKNSKHFLNVLSFTKDHSKTYECRLRKVYSVSFGEPGDCE